MPATEQRRNPTSNAAGSHPSIASIKAISPTATLKPSMPSHNHTSGAQRTAGSPDAKVVQDMKGLSLSASSPTKPNLVVNGSSGDFQTKQENGTAVSDDVSQRADSSSEIGTKAPSLDGKSVTSGTTFALDEKESLRPDDSASVKAAAEDDESFSIRGSQMASSRIGSDVARIHRLRIGDMPERRIIQILPEAQDHGIATPQSGVSVPPPPADNPQALGTVASTPDAFSTMYSQNPDEKLLEAMNDPKDRIFLLRLEQDVINFVQSSK